MDDHICFLITLLYEENQILKCALKVNQKHLTEDIIEYPMEPENKKIIHGLLPSYIQACGPIVDVEFLFDVSIFGINDTIQNNTNQINKTNGCSLSPDSYCLYHEAEIFDPISENCQRTNCHKHSMFCNSEEEKKNENHRTEL